MNRGGRIALVAHCLLDANVRARGLARWEGVHPVALVLAEKGYGIMQLPCPELGFEGISRPPRPIEEYDTPEFAEHCARLARMVLDSVARYLDAGVSVEIVVGVEGSPSCGVTAVGSLAGSDDGRAAGTGVFERALQDALAPLGVRFAAVDTRAVDGGLAAVREALGGL